MFIGCLLAGGCASTKANIQVEEQALWRTEGDQLRIDLVEALLTSRQYGRALELIRAIRDEGLDDPTLDLFQGVCLREDGMPHDAERLLLEARRRMARDPRPHQELCILYADLGRVDDAIAECRRATIVDKENPSAWNNLGYLQLTHGETTEAQTSLERAVDLDSSEPRFRNNLGLAQASNGHPEIALRTFSSTLPGSDANFNVGAALERVGDIDNALVYYGRTLELESSHEGAKAALARLGPDGAQESEP